MTTLPNAVIFYTDRECCFGCGSSWARARMGPMLHDKVWGALVELDDELLCGCCMQQRARERLGRELRVSDLRPCEFNCRPHPHLNRESWLHELVHKLPEEKREAAWDSFVRQAPNGPPASPLPSLPGVLNCAESSAERPAPTRRCLADEVPQAGPAGGALEQQIILSEGWG